MKNLLFITLLIFILSFQSYSNGIFIINAPDILVANSGSLITLNSNKEYFDIKEISIEQNGLYVKIINENSILIIPESPRPILTIVYKKDTLLNKSFKVLLEPKPEILLSIDRKKCDGVCYSNLNDSLILNLEIKMSSLFNAKYPNDTELKVDSITIHHVKDKILLQKITLPYNLEIELRDHLLHLNTDESKLIIEFEEIVRVNCRGDLIKQHLSYQEKTKFIILH